MGVNTFLLDRRTVPILIGEFRHRVGTLRRFFKVTEIDEERGKELEAAERIRPSPTAVLLMDITEKLVGDQPLRKVAAHLLLGWDEGRGSVTDLGWDYLPVLGYAIRDAENEVYVLHEEYERVLRTMTVSRARQLGLLDAEGRMLRRGQPRIAECRSVKSYIAGYAEADCKFDGGAGDTLIVATPRGLTPPPTWFLGKRPMDVKRYTP